MGATALLDLLCRDGTLKAGEDIGTKQDAAATRQTHFTPKARRAIQITVVGGMSHLDSFDYKSELARFHGKTLKTDALSGHLLRAGRPDSQERLGLPPARPVGTPGVGVVPSPRPGRRRADGRPIDDRGQCEPHARPLLLNSGFQFNGYPALGSWLSYGLGSETDDLPAYVVLPDGRGEPNGAASNWTSGFSAGGPPGRGLPQRERTGSRPVRRPADRARAERAARAFLEQAMPLISKQNGEEAMLAARIRSYELAARMQTAVPEVANLGRSRRRFARSTGWIDPRPPTSAGAVCWPGGSWSVACGSCSSFRADRSPAALGSIGTPTKTSRRTTRPKPCGSISPIAGLIRDLRQRGMLDDTLVIFTTEFGRTPFAQSAANVVGPGRDHNRYGFSCWMAGAGLKPGIAHGATDEIGWKAVESPVPWHDFHATVLHLLGIDHERLTFYHNGIRRRLTNVHGELISNILA